jgi:hypothetical protein
MNLTKDEKDFLAYLTREELKKFEKDEESVIFEPPSFLALEERYEEFLERLLKKLDQ